MDPDAMSALSLAVSLHKRLSGGIDENARSAVCATADYFYDWLKKHEMETE